MFLAVEKLTKRLEQLEKYRYHRHRSLPVANYDFRIDEQAEVAAMPPADAVWDRLSIGETWEGWDLTAWMRTSVVIPAAWAGETVVGLFDIGKTGGGNTFGFEALLYVNGVPYQGVDSNHQEVFFPQAWIGQRVEIMFKIWSGLYGWSNDKIPLKHTMTRSELTVLDPDADDLYYTGTAVLQAVTVLDENRWERQALLKALDRAFLLLDWRIPGSEAFYSSVRASNRLLQEQLQKLPKNNAVTVRCIGHSHIDVAWLWRLKHTREKAARTFSTVLRLMEQFPEYIFLQTQPQLYEDLEKDYPDIFAAVETRVREGRWEAGGAMWLESDCNIPSGESLVRQLLYGMRYFEQKFNAPCHYLWLPDVFGYSWALPQILLKCGLKYFMTSKISWNVYNRFPHDTFIWRGIDGSEIVTHYITTPNPKSDNSTFQRYYVYNGVIMADTVVGIWNNYRDKELSDELLLSFGWGDGGGGPTRSMLELRRRLDSISGIPHVKTGRADEFFARLGEAIATTDRYVHRWDGELYLELHRGTYTSQAYNKKMNRFMEHLLRNAEMTAAFCSIGAEPDAYPQTPLYESWKIVLRNQFHDILPGSSITEVYEDSRREYAEAERLAAGALQSGLQRLASSVRGEGGPGWIVLNTLSWERDELIRFPWEERFAHLTWRDAAGRIVTAERAGTPQGDMLHLLVQGVPAHGYTVLRSEPSNAANDEQTVSLQPNVVTHNGISSPFYEIAWNASGQLTRLFDKRLQREVIAKGCTANRWDVHEDKPVDHEAWEIDLFYKEKVRHIDDLQSVQVVENGLLRTVVRFIWHYGTTVVEQDMVVCTFDPRIDFVTRVNWQERQQLLKVAFPVDVRSGEATYEIQFGNVKRPTHWNTSWDYARFETCAHRWIDLSERGFGVSLLNDCKYGHDVLDNVMRITLIKSGIAPDPLADLGEHAFTYSFLSHEGDWFAAGTAVQAHRLNCPALTAPLQETQGSGGHAEETVSFIRCSGDHVVIDTVKKAEDSDAWIVRCYEFAGKRGNVSFITHAPIEQVQEVNLMERDERMVEHSGHRFDVHFTPYELKSFKLQPAISKSR